MRTQNFALRSSSARDDLQPPGERAGLESTITTVAHAAAREPTSSCRPPWCRRFDAPLMLPARAHVGPVRRAGLDVQRAHEPHCASRARRVLTPRFRFTWCSLGVMSLPRLGLFEFNDSAWVPRPLREVLIETLSRTLSWGGLLRGLVRPFEDFVASAWVPEVLDLASGAGGPARILVGEVLRAGRTPPRFLLTDLHPHAESWVEARAERPALINFVTEPVDATRITQRPRERASEGDDQRLPSPATRSRARGPRRCGRRAARPSSLPNAWCETRCASPPSPPSASRRSSPRPSSRPAIGPRRRSSSTPRLPLPPRPGMGS